MSNEIFQILSSLSKSELSLKRGELLFCRKEPVERIYLLIAGAVDLMRYQQDGRATVLRRVTSESVLAEASLYSENYHCDAVCAQKSAFRFIPKRQFAKLLSNDNRLAHQWAAYLARSLQEARYRIEILSRQTVAARLDGWLEWHGGDLPIKGHWKDIASEIDVSPEALYREIAKRNRAL